MYHVYAIKSLTLNYIYVGISRDPDERLKQHNNGYEKTTKPYRPFVIVLREEYPNRVEARKREKFLKTGAGKEYIRRIIPKS